MISSVVMAWSTYQVAPLVLFARDFADEGKLAIAVGEVHAVAYDKDRRAVEPREVRHDLSRAPHLLVEQHTGPHRAASARSEQRLGEGKRPARIENVVDDHHV